MVEERASRNHRDIRVVVVDHYDSYTWNLVHLVAGVTGVLPTVVQHDEVGLGDLLGGRFSHVVLSPGPGHPDDARDFAVGRDTPPLKGRDSDMTRLLVAAGGGEHLGFLVVVVVRGMWGVRLRG